MRPVLLRLRFPLWLDTSENFSGFLYRGSTTSVHVFFWGSRGPIQLTHPAGGLNRAPASRRLVHNNRAKSAVTSGEQEKPTLPRPQFSCFAGRFSFHMLRT